MSLIHNIWKASAEKPDRKNPVPMSKNIFFSLFIFEFTLKSYNLKQLKIH